MLVGRGRAAAANCSALSTTVAKQPSAHAACAPSHASYSTPSVPPRTAGRRNEVQPELMRSLQCGGHARSPRDPRSRGSGGALTRLHAPGGSRRVRVRRVGRLRRAAPSRRRGLPRVHRGGGGRRQRLRRPPRPDRPPRSAAPATRRVHRRRAAASSSASPASIGSSALESEALRTPCPGRRRSPQGSTRKPPRQVCTTRPIPAHRRRAR